MNFHIFVNVLFVIFYADVRKLNLMLKNYYSINWFFLFFLQITIAFKIKDPIAFISIDCSFASCPLTPRFCPDGSLPFTPLNECCPVCKPFMKIDCSSVKCVKPPKICPNGDIPIKPLNGCCASCQPTAKCASVLCEAPPAVCPNGKSPVTPPNECCPVCTADNCELVDCAPPPKCVFPPATPPNGCCPLCFTFPNYCGNILCEDPGMCLNGKPSVISPNGCCLTCPLVDCSNARCVAPTEYCKKGQVPRPPGTCCATCKLNCEGVLCAPCEPGTEPIYTPDSCQPFCKPFVV